MIRFQQLFLSAFFTLLITSAPAQLKNEATELRTLIVFFDGLRPDYITRETMPNVYAFSRAGSYGRHHHSVFPTVTRVNASSYATGSNPGTHGVMGNTVYFPEVNKVRGLDTGDHNDLEKISNATQGRLLNATSLADILHDAGRSMMVFSSGSTGQALLQNYNVRGAVVNPGLILPESFKQTILDKIGPIPANAKPNTAQHQWITNALIEYGLTLDGPLVSAIWFSDPDGTAHADGIGAPSSMESILAVDREFGRILSALKTKGLEQNFNIIISSDHGFVTHVGKEALSQFFIRQGLKKDEDSQDVVVAGGAIYVKNHDERMIRKIVSALQEEEWVGAIFTKATRAGDTKGWVEGTLAFETIHWQHPRSADILVDKNWDHRKNDMGYAGTSFSTGVAGHGGLSPYEVHIPLVAGGPSFKRGYDSDMPTSNVDIVPTILHIYNLPVPSSMDGRVMEELLEKSGTTTSKAKTETIRTTARISRGTYTLTLQQTVIGKYRYVDFARVRRRR